MALYQASCKRGDPCWIGTAFYEVKLDLGEEVAAKAIRMTIKGHVVTGGHTEIRIEARWFKNSEFGKIGSQWTQPPDIEVTTDVIESFTGQYVGFIGLPPTNDPSYHVDLDYAEVIVSTTEELPPEVLVPGTRFCNAGDLYEVNPDGKTFILIAANSPACADPGVCPDFWTDPIGAVVCWIINAIEAAVGLTAGGFLWLLAVTNDFIVSLTIDIYDFIADPISKIQEWTIGFVVTIAEFTTYFTTSITDWWNTTSTDVNTWISDAVAGITDWFDAGFSNINDWWIHVSTIFADEFDNIINGINDWISDFSTNISNWYNANVDPIIQSIIQSVNDFSSWVIAGYDSLGEWWNDQLVGFGDWFNNALSDFNDWFAVTIISLADWLNDQTVNITDWLADRTNDFNDWITNTLPGMVEGMFDWLKPIVDPIKGISDFLGGLWDALTNRYPEDPVIRESIDKTIEIENEIKDLVGEL